MRFSIIVPFYNVASYLGECLESVCGQTCADWECICVNDGSTDESMKVLADYAARDARIRVLSQANAGVAAARNHGLGQAVGEWILFLDADDAYGPDLLARIENVLRGKYDADIVYFGCREFCDSGTQGDGLCPPEGFCRGKAVLQLPEVTHRCLDKAYRKRLLDAHRIRFTPGIRLSEDTLFALKALSVAGSVASLAYEGYRYRMRSDSATHRLSPDVCRDLERAFGDFARFAADHWNVISRTGLDELAGSIILMGLWKRVDTGCRSECIGHLLSSRVFNDEAVPYMRRHGSFKHRVFAWVYTFAPTPLRRMLLGAIECRDR